MGHGVEGAKVSRMNRGFFFVCFALITLTGCQRHRVVFLEQLRSGHLRLDLYPSIGFLCTEHTRNVPSPPPPTVTLRGVRIRKQLTGSLMLTYSKQQQLRKSRCFLSQHNFQKRAAEPAAARGLTAHQRALNTGTKSQLSWHMENASFLRDRQTLFSESRGKNWRPGKVPSVPAREAKLRAGLSRTPGKTACFPPSVQYSRGSRTSLSMRNTWRACYQGKLPRPTPQTIVGNKHL